MIKAGRSLRLSRLLKGDHRRVLFVPLDHTVTDGPFTDARRYDELLGTLADNGADAIVVHKGRLRLLSPHIYAKLAVIVHISASTRYAADPSFKYRVADVEDCLHQGADAISVHVNLGSPTEDQQIRKLAEVADACERVGLPLMAMIYPRGPGIKDHPRLDTLLHAASLAVDLGADLVKLPLAGSVHEMKRVVDSCAIPVLAAGGGQISDSEFSIFIADVMKSGARGLAAGRNIFMARDPGAKLHGIRRLLDDHSLGDAQEPPAVGDWTIHDARTQRVRATSATN